MTAKTRMPTDDFSFSRRPAAALAGVALGVAIAVGAFQAEAAKPPNPARMYGRKATWAETMLSARSALEQLNVKPQDRVARQRRLWQRVQADFPVEWDWTLQDYGVAFHEWFGAESHTNIEQRAIRHALEELQGNGTALRTELDRLVAEKTPPNDRRWLDLYVRVCERRRGRRLQPLLDKWPRIVFTKHFNIGGSHYAYTEAQTDAQHERNFKPGAALCILEMDGLYGKVQTLIEDRDGVIRDPDVPFDGNRILFSWKKSDRGDDYHLYEMDVETGNVRQLTGGLGFADIEGIYLPNGDLLFNSTRCVQTVDCWWTEVSNIYTCDKDGRFLRRLAFDQVHSTFNSVLDDGRVIYTRWDYNDRAQIYPQALFQMNSDGTGQTEFYGNNSWFPTTITHARGIPGTQKIVAILTGHHTYQVGKLAIIDPDKGRQENSGVQLIAPVRKTDAPRIDRYGQEGDLFQYPYPLDETRFLVGYSPLGGNGPTAPFNIYFMDINGRRELLVADPKISCNQPIPLAPRKKPKVRPSAVDYRKETGTYYLQDIYAGPGLEGIERGTVKWLRVVGLDFRAAGIGDVRNGGPGGGALASTPIGVGNTAWDVKIVLGTTPVYEDGSACFVVPARTPVYFQALDAKNHVVQSMRSWSTLQPGEMFACVGCHESKNASPLLYHKRSEAMAVGPRSLEPFYGPPRGFSFRKEIQPILDRHCISCHSIRPATRNEPILTEAGNTLIPATEDGKAFSLLGAEVVDPFAKRRWSDAYLALTQARSIGRNGDGVRWQGSPNGKLVNWNNVMTEPSMLAAYSGGAAKSRLIALLEEGHYDIPLSREDMDKIACWIDLLVPFCGDYAEAHAWSEAEVAKYDHFLRKRRRMEAVERRNIDELIEILAKSHTHGDTGF